MSLYQKELMAKYVKSYPRKKMLLQKDNGLMCTD